MIPAVAIDLDGTFVTVNTFTSFVKWLAARLCRRCDPMAGKVAATVLLRKLRLITHARAKEIITGIATLRLGREEIDSFVDTLSPHVNPRVSDMIDRWRGEGRRIILATAAPAVYASRFGERHGFDRTVGSESGSPECKGEEKKKRVLALCDSNGWKLTAAVSDHSDDTPLLTIPGIESHIIS